jgi:hypothetical protein
MRGLAVVGNAVLALVVGCAVAGCAGTASTQHPASSDRPSRASAQPAAAPSATAPAGSPSAEGSDCPATPVSGPAHTVTFPDSIGSYQLISGPSSTEEYPLLGQGKCTAPAEYGGYEDSQGNFVTIEAAHHANLWPTFSSFWGAYLAKQQGPVISVPVGPLGGQAGCSTIPGLGAVCVWFDSDTFGSLLEGEPSVSESEVASLMLVFRAGVEHSG